MGAVGGGGAEEQVAGLGPLEEEVEVVLPGEPDAAVQLEAVPREQALALAGGRLGHRGRHRPPVVVLGDGQGGEVARATRPAPRRGSSRPAGASGPGTSRSAGRTARGPWRTAASPRRSPGRWPRSTAASAVVASCSARSTTRPAAGSPGSTSTRSPPTSTPDERDGGDRQGGVDHGARLGGHRRAGHDEHAEPGLAAGDHGHLRRRSRRRARATSRRRAPSRRAGSGVPSSQPPMAARRRARRGPGCPCRSRSRWRRAGRSSPPPRRSGTSCVAVARNGRRRHGSAELLHHDADLEVPESEPAVLGGDPEGRPVELHQRRPELVAVARALEDRAHQRWRAGRGQHRPGVLPQRQLVVGELEVHQRLLREGQEAAADRGDHRLDGVGLGVNPSVYTL